MLGIKNNLLSKGNGDTYYSYCSKSYYSNLTLQVDDPPFWLIMGEMEIYCIQSWQ